MQKLNHEQQRVKQAIEAMQPGDRLVVSGRAGSGKTYAIANSISERKALLLAPTHPARSVLEQELSDDRHMVATIHSAISWFQQRGENLSMVQGYLPAKEAHRRTERYEEKKGSMFADVDIVVVDEFSMVGSFLFRAVEEYAKEFGVPVVYSGDRFQLPPVNDREVVMDQGFKTITIDSSMRFPKGSEIYRFGEMLRERIENDPNDELPKLIGGKSVQVMLGREWMNDLTQGYRNCDRLLAVTSDNKTLRRLRRKVRQVDHDCLCEGDLVVSKQTDEHFRNGEEFTIARIEPDTIVLEDVPRCVSSSRNLTLHGFTAHFSETDKIAFVLDNERDASKLSSNILDLHENGKLEYDEAARVLDWLDQINRFELSAIATVHKSQGRSVDTVYIDTDTVLKRPSWLSYENHKRLLYTGITRARKRVVFYEMQAYCTRMKPALEAAASSFIQLDHEYA